MKVWPFGVALRGEASNRLMLRRLNAVRGERWGKGAPRRQVGIRKANASESLLKCRNPKYDIETGAYNRSWDESGGCPFTGQVVSGMKATRS